MGVLESSLAILLAVGLVTLVGTIALILVLGYVVLTGWRGFSKLSALLRIVASFLTGILVSALSMPLGSVIPIPFVPTLLVAAGMWLVLRKLTENSGVSQVENLSVDQAETIAHQTLQSRLINVALTATGAEIEGNRWKLSFQGSDSKAYEVTVDAHTGHPISWGKTAK
jgi:hypothetical protein